MSKTKIVATVGPSSNSPEMLLKLCKTGVNVFRLNMSHGDHAGHLKVIKALKNIQEKYPVAILGDIQGPKIRVGSETNINLKKGKTYSIGKGGDVETPNFSVIKKSVKVGEVISFSDGQIQSKIVKLDEKIHIKIIQEGHLTANKGMNLPDTHLKLSCLTEKDKKDLVFLSKNKVDYIALSFVQTAKDILDARKFVKQKISVVSKIELPTAIENIDEIIEVSDAVMVARGDLAVEVGNANFPKYQKEIIKKCNKSAKPVITATQMMESMISNLNPTRAEVMDVYNAVLDGSDALMLSAETATGVDPCNVVKVMREVSGEAEKAFKVSIKPQEDSITSNLQSAGIHLAENINAQAVVSLTERGKSCRKIAAYRSKVPVIGATNKKETYHKMALFWGVEPVLLESKNFKKELPKKLKDHLKRVFKKGKAVVCSASAEKKNSENFLFVQDI